MEEQEAREGAGITMKMSEFLRLSDDEKTDLLDAVPEADKDNEDYSGVTEDTGICSVCRKVADAGDFCFGCHKLVCLKCIDIEPHLSACLSKR